MVTLINGFQITQAVRVASTLRVADHLKDGARSRYRRRLSRRCRPEVYPDPHGRLFADRLSTPVGGSAEHVGNPLFWQAWGHFLYSVRTGNNAFKELHGMDVWQYREQHPDAAATFNRAMTQMSRGGTEAVLSAYDFSSFRHIVDVGGGQGALLAAILSVCPHARGTLFDQPQAVAGAKRNLENVA
jgi:hypothetical protein